MSYLVARSELGAEELRFFDDFHTALEELERSGVLLKLSGRREEPTQIHLTFSNEAQNAFVKVWDDYLTHTRYLEIWASDAAIIDRIETVMRGYLDIEDPAELLQRAQARMGSEPELVPRCAYGAPEAFDAQYLELIAEAIRHPSPTVRTAGARAAGILGWAEFVPVIEDQMERERPGEVMADLDSALRVCAG